jgi:hypothetical protein
MSGMPASMLGLGVRTTTSTVHTVRWAVYRPQSSRVAVLLPVGLRPPSSSTASLFQFPNPYSHSNWTENRGIPVALDSGDFYLYGHSEIERLALLAYRKTQQIWRLVGVAEVAGKQLEIDMDVDVVRNIDWKCG